MPRVTKLIRMQLVPGGLAPQRCSEARNQLFEIFVALQQITQVNTPFAKEAKAQFAACGDAQPIAAIAEARPIRRNKAKATQKVRMGKFRCRTIVPAALHRVPAALKQPSFKHPSGHMLAGKEVRIVTGAHQLDEANRNWPGSDVIRKGAKAARGPEVVSPDVV